MTLKAIIEKLRFMANGLSYLGLWNTMYLNFVCFPFSVAIRFPVLVGKRVTMQGIHKGCIALEGQRWRAFRYKTTIGISPYPMMANKGSYTLLRFMPNAKLQLGKSISIGSGSSIIVMYNGKLLIEDNVVINQHCLLYCAQKVTIGKCVRIGWQCQIYDSDFHFIFREQDCTIRNNIKPITIGHNVWLANNVSVTKGAYIPAFSIVASRSLMNKDFSDVKERGVFFAGQPAQKKSKVGLRIINELEQNKLFNYFASSGEEQINVLPEDTWFTNRY